MRSRGILMELRGCNQSGISHRVERYNHRGVKYTLRIGGNHLTEWRTQSSDFGMDECHHRIRDCKT